MPATAVAAAAVAAAPPQAQGCTCAKLRRLNRRLTAVYDRELAAVGLRVTQFSLLAGLRSETASAGVPLTELAGRMDMDRTTLTRGLRPLVEQGWAEMIASEHDARVRLVRLTAEGRALWQQARPHWKRAQNEVAATLGADQVARLHQLLDAATPLFRPAAAPAED
jgi:DNA-binding MarR family transcriptional regulator